jgi:hypothetical protein
MSETRKWLLFWAKTLNGWYGSLLAVRIFVCGTSLFARIRIVVCILQSRRTLLGHAKKYMYCRRRWWELITGMFNRLPTNVRSQSHTHETTNLMRLLVKLDSVRCIASRCKQVPHLCRWGHATILIFENY